MKEYTHDWGVKKEVMQDINNVIEEVDKEIAQEIKQEKIILDKEFVELNTKTQEQKLQEEQWSRLLGYTLIVMIVCLIIFITIILIIEYGHYDKVIDTIEKSTISNVNFVFNSTKELEELCIKDFKNPLCDVVI